MTLPHAEVANIHAWIRYLDGQRSLAMDTIDAIKTRMDGMEAAAGRIAAEVADLKGKLDAASIEDPRLSAIADHAAAILDKLNAVAPAPVEAAAEPVAEAPVEQPAQ